MAFECLDFHICVFFFIFQLQHEKAELEQHLEQEQEFQVNKLMKKIKKLENDTISKQLTLEQVKMYGSLSVSLIRIVLFFFFFLISTVLSNFKRSCGISVKNIFHLCLHTVGTSIWSMPWQFCRAHPYSLVLFCSFQPQLIRFREICCDVLIYRPEMLGSFCKRGKNMFWTTGSLLWKFLRQWDCGAKSSPSRVLQNN